MSFFSKKENEELFALIESDDTEGSNGLGASPFNPHALTPEEVSGFSVAANESKAESTNALEMLKKRMLEARVPVNEEQSSEPEKSEDTETEKKAENTVSLNSFYTEKETAPPAVTEKPKPHGKTLLEKCRPYILDDSGKDVTKKAPADYKLESVADILKSDGQKALESLSEKYSVSFDDLGKSERKTHGSESAESFYDTIPAGGGVSHIQTNVSHIISDIDGENESFKPKKEKDISSTATIKFTPVSDSDSAAHISISSATRPIDLTGELAKLPEEDDEQISDEVQLEQTDFEDFVPKEEFSSPADAKHILRLLSIKKRSAFLKTAASVILTLILAFMKLPFMSGFILKNTKPCMIICTVLLSVAVIVNCDMFLSLKTVFSRRSSADTGAALASLSVILYAVTGIIKNEITLDLILLCAVLLTVRAMCAFFTSSSLLSGFKQIAAPSPKRAVKLISDPAVTFAMAKNSVEGDVLAAAPQRTAHINDYMKYSCFKTVLGGRLPFVTVLSLILSVILGFACASYFDGMIYGFYAAAAVQCLAALPPLFLIDSLPLYSSSKKLSRLGAMLAGKTGAEHIEKANAMVLSSEDIFPSGTVTLHNLQMLSSNSIDDTIIRAASLTDALNSPLSPIFKKIAGTGGNVILPKSDTVKYEDKMGISGWVDNKLLFVGNRTLMEAHGIEVPSVETDRKILRNGYFPVYVATENKACALLAVQYNVRPDISRELRRISALGVTMLINSSDPNMTEEMICDYMGLYEDSVKVMSAAGCHMYKNAVTYAPDVSAPAAYKGNPIGLAAIINAASKIKKSNILLTVLYVLSAVIGTVLFAYASFAGSGTLISGAAVLLYGLICTAVSLILYLTQKP